MVFGRTGSKGMFVDLDENTFGINYLAIGNKLVIYLMYSKELIYLLDFGLTDCNHVGLYSIGLQCLYIIKKQLNLL